MQPCFPSTSVSDCVVPVIAGAVAALLLFYPIRVSQVPPLVQLAICISLTTFGISTGAAYFLCSADSGCSACHQWVLALASALSLFTVIVPSIGAIIGLGVASGLIVNALYPNPWFVGLATLGGLASMFIYRDLLLHWQLFVPPVVGGYLAASAVGSISAQVTPSTQYIVWLVAAVVSLLLHIRRRRTNSWLEQKQDLAVNSKESQIVQVMRHSNPTMTVEEFEKMKVRLLQVVDGDQEQADRVVFGGGLY